ncbi:hypothetical protein JCM9533A_63160 [Catenuloplanes niger JCM 9533]
MWTRDPERCAAARDAVAGSAAEVLQPAGVGLMMLADGEAIDAVLGRGPLPSPRSPGAKGPPGTTSPECSQDAHGDRPGARLCVEGGTAGVQRAQQRPGSGGQNGSPSVASSGMPATPGERCSCNDRMGVAEVARHRTRAS